MVCGGSSSPVPCDGRAQASAGPDPREGTSQIFQELQFKAIFPLLAVRKDRAESQALALSSMFCQ